MQLANLALKFLLEIAAFAALTYVGAALGSGVWAVVLAVTFPAVAIAIWARWNAPRSAHRLPARARIPCELAVFAAAALGLFVTGAVMWAVAYVVLVVINAVLMTAMRQWEA